ncbi:FxsA family protein [Natranaeroarchaeum aerophilus]|uniref:Membrane protein FxsA n=1 Tax=Natranaeroarchaeum aerophilus TaxID=2917711 RepID=A0AAE3FQ41_9EURY|nr:FxsA family protein [Natranaeroarchaeum aerophilus]MCL9812808.1 membrane protein FxsA [Natranaeroarchaeum aerophilus]
MFKRILALLMLIPLLDSVLLVALGIFWVSWIGGLEIVLLVVLTALIGTLAVHAEGKRTIRKLQRSLRAGDVPTNQLIDGGFLIAAGAFLLTPGLVTDLIGFLLVIPPTRIAIRAVVKKFVIVPYIDKQTGGFATGNVYTFGFPGDTNEGPGPAQAGNPFDIDGGSGGADDSFDTNPRSDGGDDVYDLGDDSYDVEFDESGESPDR